MKYDIDPRISRHYLDMTAEASRKVVLKGLSPDGTSGDVSMRDPQTGLIYITGHLLTIPFPYADLTEYRAQDMVVYDPDGNKLTPWSVSTVETPMHLAVFKARKDVDAIVHFHPKWSSVFSIIREKMPILLSEQFYNLGGEVEVADYYPAGEFANGDVVVKALGDKRVALMANHGAIAVGPTFAEAFRYADFLEEIAQKSIFSMLLGEVHALGDKDKTPSKLMEGTYEPKQITLP